MQKNENCGVLKGIIIARHHTPTWWVACDFSHAIVSEFSDEACDCCMSLFFICRSLIAASLQFFHNLIIKTKNI